VGKVVLCQHDVIRDSATLASAGFGCPMMAESADSEKKSQMINSDKTPGRTNAIADDAKVVHKFRDGTFITQTDLHNAEIEMKAIFIYWSAPFAAVMKGQVGKNGIWKENMLLKNPELNEMLVRATINAQMQAARPRLSQKNLTDEESWGLRIGNTTPHALAREQLRGKIHNSLQCITKHPNNWTMLGVGSEADLVKMVRACYGVKFASEVRKNNLFPRHAAIQLLARKNRIESTRALADKAKKNTNGLKRTTKSRAVKIPSKRSPVRPR
jgi:hypothetical protein